MNTIILTVALILTGLFCIGGILAGEWYRKNMNEPVVRGYIE